MRREWAVVCDAPDHPALLTAWELPGQSAVRDRDRLFEAIWTRRADGGARRGARVRPGRPQLGHAEAAPLLYELAENPPPAAGRAAARDVAAQPGRRLRRPPAVTPRRRRDSIAPMRTRGLARIVVVVVAVLLAGLVRGSGADAAPVTLVLRPSVNQLYVLQATPGQALELVSGTAVVATGTVDASGSLAWRDLAAGAYAVRVAGDPSSQSATVNVTDFDAPPPPASFYSAQTLDPGFGYLTTRDGTTLSANVVLPAGKGPFPTVVEYSGYDPSRPGTSTMAHALQRPRLRLRRGQHPRHRLLGRLLPQLRGDPEPGRVRRDRDHRRPAVGRSATASAWSASPTPASPSSTSPAPSRRTWPRSRRCRSSTTPTAARSTRAASSTPGSRCRGPRSAPSRPRRTARAGRSRWSTPATPPAPPTSCCACRTPTRSQLITDNPYYSAKIGDPITPSLFADDIDVPVFIAGAWQDEQTGGHWPAILDDLTSAPHVYATLTNGSHTESLSLGVFGRYADFLDLYVGHRKPQAVKNIVAPILAESITGVSGLGLPPGPTYNGMSYREALRKFEAQKPVRVLFEEGAADGQPSGAPLPRFEASFSSWPVKKAKATAWYLTPSGRSAPLLLAAEARPGQGAQLPRRARGAAADDVLRVELRHLEGPPEVPLEADPEGHRPGLDQPAAEEERRGGRHRIAGPVGPSLGPGHRPRGHAERGTSERHRGLRPVRLAARQPPEAGRQGVDEDLTGPHRPRGRRPAVAGGPLHARYGSSSSPSATRSAPAPASASPSTPPAARGRSGPSTPSPTARR